MKKIISVLLSGTIISFVTTGNVTAQVSAKGLSNAAIKNDAALISYAVASSSFSNEKAKGFYKESLKEAEANSKESKAALKALKANDKASHNFNRMFKDAPEAKWAVEEQAIVAFFIKDEAKTWVVYDKKGNWIHNITQYSANKTPQDIRSIVESAYPYSDITVTTAIKEGYTDFYIVQLEDKRSYKKVTVYNGEANLIEELQKSH